ncbi:hypothetical protein D9757_007547 [Collybiopsis confluens]|uniref:Protein kinase domain-containing protein n=1 Tax=Collybiopsis confluens TaxID=2823264 RepID=A0A8H5HEP6_9AGAR|nr:hypothetical protein D9757_007547 [Collybiopsis confluens]
MEKDYIYQAAISEWDALSDDKPNTSHSNNRGEPAYSWLDAQTAQQIIDWVQLELDSELDSAVRYRRLGFLRYLSKKFQILPSSLIVRDVRREGWNPVAGGGFADIWRGSLKERAVCLKVLRFAVEQDESTRARMRKQFCQEALVWRQLHHPNILPLLGVNTELFFPSFCLISPWMEKRDIISYLKMNPEHGLLSVSRLGYNIYIQENPPSFTEIYEGRGNILVTDDHHCCLADFGLTLVTTDSSTWTMTTSGTGVKGSMRWLAPEYISISGSVPNHTSRDVYAFGCTIIEIVTQKPPFHDLKNDASVLLSLVSGARPARPENSCCSDEIWHLATCCWAQSVNERPSANTIYNTLSGLVSTPESRPSSPSRSRQGVETTRGGSVDAPSPLALDAGSGNSVANTRQIMLSARYVGTEATYARLQNGEDGALVLDLQTRNSKRQKTGESPSEKTLGIYESSSSYKSHLPDGHTIVDQSTSPWPVPLPWTDDSNPLKFSHPGLVDGNSTLDMYMPPHEALWMEESSPFRFSPPDLPEDLPLGGVSPDVVKERQYLPPRYERSRSRPLSSSSSSSLS